MSPSRRQRYLAWRRAKRWHLGPNGFIVLLVVALVLGVLMAFVGPEDDGIGMAFLRALPIGLVVGVLANVLAARERRRHQGSASG